MKSYIGKIVGKLTVISELPSHMSSSGRKVRKFLCRCSCGADTHVGLPNLISGATKSCGCLRDESVRIPLEEYKKRGSDYGLIYVSGYTGDTKAKIVWRCAYNHEFQVGIHHLRKCSYCSGFKMSADKILSRLEGRNIEWLGPLVGSHKHTQWKCSRGHTWWASARNVAYNGSGCPECNRKRMSQCNRCEKCGKIISSTHPCILCESSLL